MIIIILISIFCATFWIFSNQRKNIRSVKNSTNVLNSFLSMNKNHQAIGIPILESSTKTQVLTHEEDIKKFQSRGSIWIESENNSLNIFICEPKILKKILVSDFSYFHSRNDRTSGDPILGQMLNSLHGQKWKKVRNILSPTFTTGRIKCMKHGISQCIQNFIEELSCVVLKNSQFIDANSLFSNITTDIIALTAFGLKINSIKDPKNEFLQNVHILSSSQTPKTKGEQIEGFGNALNYFINLIKTEMEKRSGSVGENLQNDDDFIEILKKSHENLPNLNGQCGIEDMTLFAQAILFIFASHDTNRITLTMLLVNIAKNREIQEKIRNDDENSSYLSACIKETLRLTSPLVRLRRKCQENYKLNFNNRELVIPKDTMVYIPIWALHRNPQFHKNPDQFEPERFLKSGENLNSKEEIEERKFSFLGFGAGPRNCLGQRFGQEQIKMIVCELLKRFEVSFYGYEEVEFLPNMPFSIEFMKPVMIKLTPI